MATPFAASPTKRAPGARSLATASEAPCESTSVPAPK